MKQNEASITALLSAFGRAFHAEEAEAAVFADTVAKQLLTNEEYAAIGRYITGGIDFFAPDKKGCFASEEEQLRYLVNTQIAPTPLGRARYCEECLETAMRTGTKQYVLLGAGLDTFAFRRPDFAGRYDVYEVDHPQTQQDKIERIRRAGLDIPARLHFVAVDFSADDPAQKLSEAGFDPKKKTLFSWLGVSYYLTEEQIGGLLDAVAALSADGSSLVFDYADEGLFDTTVRRVRNMVAMAAAGGEPMQTCFAEDALVTLLERHGFLLYDLLFAPDIRARYFAGRTDGLTAFEHICYALAVVKK